MEQEYDLWNVEKKKIVCKQRNEPHIKEGEVWVAIIGKNVGLEQDGGKNFSRPVLVLKVFNYKMFWAIPLSSKQKDLDFYYNFIDPFDNNASAVLAQLKLMSIKRVKRRLYRFPLMDFLSIKKIISNMIY